MSAHSSARASGAGEPGGFPFLVRSARSTRPDQERVDLPPPPPAARAQQLVFEALGSLPAYFDPARFADAPGGEGGGEPGGEGGGEAGVLAAVRLLEAAGLRARPPALIREVLAMPPVAAGVPAADEPGGEERAAWALLAEADAEQAMLRYDGALRRLRAAYAVWDQRWLAQQRKARDDLVAGARDGLEAARAALAEVEAERDRLAAEGEDDEFGGYAAKRDREAAMAEVEKRRREAAGEAAEAEGRLAEASTEPDTADRPRGKAEMRLEVALLLRVGDIALATGRNADATVAYWRAKESLDQVLHLHARGGEGASLVHDTMVDFNDLTFDEVRHVDGVPGDKDPVHYRQLADPHPVSGTVYSCLGTAAFHSGRPDLALKSFALSKTLRFQSISATSQEFVDIGSSLNNMACALYAQGRPFAASYFFDAALEVLETRFEAVHPRVETARANAAKMRPLVSRAVLGAGSTVFSDALRALAAQGKPLSTPQWKVKLTGTASAVHKATLAGGGKKKKGGGKKKKKKGKK